MCTGGVRRYALGNFFNGDEVPISTVQSATDAMGQQSHYHTVILRVVTAGQILQ